MAVLVLLVYIILTWIGLKGVLKGKNKMETAVFFLILAVSFLYNYFGIALRMNLPHINDLMGKAVEPLSELIFGARQ